MTALLETPVAVASGLSHYLNFGIEVYESQTLVLLVNFVFSILFVVIISQFLLPWKEKSRFQPFSKTLPKMQLNIGAYVGHYQHLSQRLPEERRRQKTKFTLRIRVVNGHHFEGEIEEDLQSGGMEGKGTIEGKLVGEKIFFVKQMPKQTVYLNQKIQVVEGKKHRKLYYSGRMIDGKYRGEWHFRFGVGLIQKRLVVHLPIKGTWEMDSSTHSI